MTQVKQCGNAHDIKLAVYQFDKGKESEMQRNDFSKLANIL